MTLGVKLLSVSGNYAVVHLDHRNFPALAIQGDSLKILQEAVEEFAECWDGGDVDDARYALAEVSETIRGMLLVYQEAAREQGFELPYFPGGRPGRP
ncbi:DUF6959 family protein [Saccharothrix violaceirubra]|uniref:Uncharacterized protein n=1 Tax=Saccharothrix violaceirubra TaxID=413306 RepID=A0A7W7WTR1_9PSEU|nr:hypothetical protein [Saccharothrix violaceirubra]MBB4963440.1 hypothetical protein [Saccharothrix violaceirubra]